MHRTREIIGIGPIEVTEEQRRAALESPEYQALLDALARLALDKFRRLRAREEGATQLYSAGRE